MELSGKTIGFALCGSFCTFSKAIDALIALKDAGADIIPIMSETAYSTDTRFGESKHFVSLIEDITGNKVLHTVYETEPIGPKKMLDALVILPCTGNTLAKLSCGVCDTPVTLAAKAHLRNDRPLVIALASNDSLSANAENFGRMLARRNVYFVPIRQDDALTKPRSMVCDFTRLKETMDKAIQGVQIQPILI